MKLQRYFYLFVIGLFMIAVKTTMAQTQCPPPQNANPIQVENCLTGRRDWQIPVENIPVGHQIEGYASHTSINVGERIRFHLNVSSPQTVNIDIYRLGYYGGLGARAEF